MSAAPNARRLIRTAFTLSLLCASPLAAQTPAPAAEPAPATDTSTPAATSAAPAAKPSSRQQIARELFERGREKWRNQQYEEAAALFTASNAQSERPATLLLLAESLEKLGRLRTAHETFQRAAELARRQNDADAEARADTRTAAVAPMVPEMEIRFSVPPPERALVTLNGVELPHEWLNRAVPFDAGEFQLQVRAPGYAPYSAQIVLSNAAARLGVQVVPVTLTPLAAPELEPVAPAPPLTPEDSGTASRRQLAWISGGVGAAAAVTGLVLTLVALDKKKSAAPECSEALSGKDPCSARGDALRGEATKFANLATVSALASGAALATSFTLFVLAEQSATPTGAGITYRGSF
jgi:tetratricopeptide (TPR) repeat protein